MLCASPICYMPHYTTYHILHTPHLPYQMDQRINSSTSTSTSHNHRGRDYQHSTQDSLRHSASPRQSHHCHSPSPDSYKCSRQDFQSSANRTPLSACAVCLGRHTHKIIECKAVKTWDNAHDTLCTQVGKILTMQDS